MWLFELIYTHGKTEKIVLYWPGDGRPLPNERVLPSIRSATSHYLSNHVPVAYGDIFDEMVHLSKELGFRIRALAHGK
jgi:hypothetical protein